MGHPPPVTTQKSFRADIFVPFAHLRPFSSQRWRDCSLRSEVLLSHFSLLLGLAAVASAQEAPLAILLKTPPGQMRYDRAQFSVPPGRKVVLTLENHDEMPHNLVICKPGNDQGLEVAQQAWAMGEQGVAKDWVPEHERVLVSGKMAPPHGQQDYAFTAPAEPGEYPYVCTFPGHAMTMHGVMRVAADGPRIKGLGYQLYLGNWQQLPDFSQLTPSREGKLESGRLGWKFGDYQNQFGLVFTGQLTAPQAGKYRFTLASDDGAEILIDGHSILKNDGIHPAGSGQTRELELPVGDHALVVRYFQQAGEAELYVAWSGPGFSETALSEWVPANRRDPNQNAVTESGIVLAPEQGRPVIYRNFIEGSSPRGIAVGYPGGLNLVFDADQMNLALLWRGAFMDAHKHWTDRGAGNQGPLGYAEFRPVPQTAGIATLADPVQTPWPNHEPRAAGLTFLGYRLDPHGFPTFHYRQGSLDLEETYTPVGTDADPQAKLIRTVRLTGTAAPHTFLRAAVGDLKSDGNLIHIGPTWTLQVEGSLAQLRDHELLIPLDPASSKEIKLTYQWAL